NVFYLSRSHRRHRAISGAGLPPFGDVNPIPDSHSVRCRSSRTRWRPHGIRKRAAPRGATHRPLRSLNKSGDSMQTILTQEECFLMYLLSDGPVKAIGELERLAIRLASMQLVALDDSGRWRLTQVGEALLEKQSHHLLH